MAFSQAQRAGIAREVTGQSACSNLFAAVPAKTGLAPAIVSKALAHLARLNIVTEVTDRKRNRLFSYAGYSDILNRDTEPAGN